MVSSSFGVEGTMSEERFNEIDRRFDELAADVSELKTDVAELKTDVAGLKTDVAGLKTDVAGLKTDVAGLKTDVAGLKTETVGLRRHMGVLHEDVIDRIRGIREDDSLRQEMRAGFAMILKRLDDHAIPGEAADRGFAATLADHEKRITAIERASS
jgi:outer membrane murein-binding lipoprotein Lpp